MGILCDSSDDVDQYEFEGRPDGREVREPP